MSGEDISTEYSVFAGQPLFYHTALEGDWLFAYDECIHAVMAGQVAAALGVWPGDSRTRWVWCHGFAAPGPDGWFTWWDDWAVGDHIVMTNTPFRTGFGGTWVRGITSGVFAPYH